MRRATLFLHSINYSLVHPGYVFESSPAEEGEEPSRRTTRYLLGADEQHKSPAGGASTTLPARRSRSLGVLANRGSQASAHREGGVRFFSENKKKCRRFLLSDFARFTYHHFCKRKPSHTCSIPTLLTSLSLRLPTNRHLKLQQASRRVRESKLPHLSDYTLKQHRQSYRRGRSRSGAWGQDRTTAPFPFYVSFFVVLPALAMSGYVAVLVSHGRDEVRTKGCAWD